MKRFLKCLCITVFIIFVTSNKVFAANAIKNFHVYEVKNVNVKEFSIAAKQEIMSYTGSDNLVPLENIQNAYIYSGEVTYFVRLYPANTDTNIFIVTNEDYDEKDNDITRFLQKNGYKYSKSSDKDAMKEYKVDFYNLARKQALGNFYITPDVVKPLKTGMRKLNNKMAKNSKKTSVMPYSIDSEPIDLKCIDTAGYYDKASEIAILRKEYRLKQKENRYLHAFEYVVTNNNTETAKVNVTSQRLAGMKDVATETYVDFDRIDAIGAVASFPPIVICTCGLSMLGCVPSWLNWVKITKEVTRYAHALPENYNLRSNGRMRILVLKYREDQKPLDFDIQFPGKNYKISF